MRILGALFLVIVSFAAYAQECQRSFPIIGFSGEEMHFRITGTGTRGESVVRVYSDDRLVRMTVTHNATFTIGGLPEASYSLSINGRKSASFLIKPLASQSSLQLGDRVYSLSMPELKTGTVNGHKLTIVDCPVVNVLAK
jgi:hypothetical protein